MDPTFGLTPSYSPLGLLGFRFQPTDQEILLVHLHKLVVEKQPLSPPLDKLVRRCDVFGNKAEPSAIWNDFGGDQIYDLDGSLYFVCKLKNNGCRIDRKIGKGTWSETESYKDVPRFDPNEDNCPGEIGSSSNPVIGKKRKFRYENPDDEITKDHTAWLLDEYSLIDTDGDVDQKDSSETSYDFDYVICRLRRNGRAQSSGNQTVRNSDKKRKRSINEKMVKPTSKRVKKDQSKEKMIEPTNKRVKKDQSKEKMLKPRRNRVKKDQSKEKMIKPTIENVKTDQPTCSSEKLIQARNEKVEIDQPTCTGTTTLCNPGDAYMHDESNTTTMDDIWQEMDCNQVMNDYHPRLSFDDSNTTTIDDIWAELDHDQSTVGVAVAYSYHQPTAIALVDGDKSVSLDQLAQNNCENEYFMNQLLDRDQSTAADAYGYYQLAAVGPVDSDQSATLDQLAQNNYCNENVMNQLLDTTNYGNIQLLWKMG